MTRVLAFGSFDPLHEGHLDFFRQAKSLGDYVLVVVARDAAIRATKNYEPYQDEATRLAAVAASPAVDEAILGSQRPHHYEMLSELDFDVVALGYDQSPDEDTVRRELDARGKSGVKVVRLAPYHAEKYKGTYIRPTRPSGK